MIIVGIELVVALACVVAGFCKMEKLEIANGEKTYIEQW